MPTLRIGEQIGVDEPEGQRFVSVREMADKMQDPKFKDALELCAKADKFPDGSYVGRHAIFEIFRGTQAGKNIEIDTNFAEKVAAEKKRLAYG